MKELSRKGRRNERTDEFSKCNNFVEGLVGEQLPPSSPITSPPQLINSPELPQTASTTSPS